MTRSKIILLLTIVAASVLWSYTTTLQGLVQRWAHDAHYSHGYLVPLFALALLGLRRRHLHRVDLQPSGWGFAWVLVGAALRLAGTYYYFDWLEAVSLLPCLAGLCLLGLGRPGLRWAGPSIAFLFFMIPLPYKVEQSLGYPLQLITTEASTYALQTMGYPAISEGVAVRIEDHVLEVAETCNGLSMLVSFFAVSTAVALVLRRPAWEGIALVLSAAPLALLSNIARVTATEVALASLGGGTSARIFHDFAGWVMMPLALALLWLELQIMARLFAEPAADLAEVRE